MTRHRTGTSSSYGTTDPAFVGGSPESASRPRTREPNRPRSLEGDGAGYPYYSVPCNFCRRHSPGVVQGHQLGLCQHGAAGMARSGAGYREILEHYYPGTSVMQSEANAFIDDFHIHVAATPRL